MTIEGILAVGIGILFLLISWCCNKNKRLIKGIQAELKLLKEKSAENPDEIMRPNRIVEPINKSLENKIETVDRVWGNIVKTSQNKKLKKGNLVEFALVLDKSGSMRYSYEKGIIQETVERVLAIVLALSIKKECVAWAYDDSSHRLTNISTSNIKNFISREIPNPVNGGNNELVVIKDVIKKFIYEQKILNETVVLFVTDGGVGNASEIKNILTLNKEKPIFWQFIGVGEANFGVLRDLKDLQNTNFLNLNDLKNISDKELYERLLSSFPNWLNAR